MEVHVTKVFDLVGCEMLGHDLWKMPMSWGGAPPPPRRPPPPGGGGRGRRPGGAGAEERGVTICRAAGCFSNKGK